MRRNPNEPTEEIYDNEPLAPEELPSEPELVSTSQAINLTCTLAAFFGFFALFLYFADQRSNAVRRISVQSTALTAIFLVISAVLMILGGILSMIPLIGIAFSVVFWCLFAIVVIAALLLKIRMMMHAYRGYAYVLPVIGEKLRHFE